MELQEYRDYESHRLEQNKKRMLEDGVIFADIYNAYIDDEVVIEEGAYIANNVTIRGKSKICSGARIGQSSLIADSIIGSNTIVDSSYVYESVIGSDSKIGPFAYIRPGSNIGDACRVGDFVEVKNSSIGNGSKSSHLTYIGDADIGSNVNIGCGVVFVNYDGSNKYRTTVGQDAFVGCNTNLISPVKVGDGAYIAAGTTVTDDVPSDALCIGRERQTIKEHWVKARKILKKDK